VGVVFPRRTPSLPHLVPENLALGRSEAFFSLVQFPMVVHLIRHGSAVKKDASVSAAVRQDNDRVVETSIPARLDDLRCAILEVMSNN